MRYIFISFLLLICLSSPLSARCTLVTSVTSINSGKWASGDTIVLKNGEWTDQSLILRDVGTALQPIVFIAETPGGVIFNGSSKIYISGRYLEVSGILFKDGTLKGTVVEFRTSTGHAENCRLTNCAIMNYKSDLITDNTKWVSLFGKNNRIDNCTFENKTNLGTLLVVWMTAGTIPSHIIENNYFGFRDPIKDDNGGILNGQEIIRIGGGDSLAYANCIVRNNFFEKCNGEGEIISNKSCGNLYSNNVFLECQGALTLRYGHDCIVEGNYFLGNGVERTGGVRIVGEDHKVYNNYFENLTGTKFSAGLSMVRGMLNTSIAEYFQVKNAIVTFNTFVNCVQSFCINVTNNETVNTLPPINTVIAHNHIYNTSSANTNVIIIKEDPIMDITWKNNFMNQGQYTSFTYNSSQIITGQDPKMEQVETPIAIFEPKNGSALADYTTNDYANVTSDIRGRARNNNAKIPGASQIEGMVTRVMPLKNSVGAAFFKDITTVDTISDGDLPFVLFSSLHGYLSMKSTVNGQINVYDIRGKSVGNFQVIAHSCHDKYIGKGLFIVKFYSEIGKSYIQKMIY